MVPAGGGAWRPGDAAGDAPAMSCREPRPVPRRVLPRIGHTDGSRLSRRPIPLGLGLMPAQPGPAVQIFGVDDSQATRAALRFFKERRIPVSYVDLRRKAIAPGELRRFVERLGARALADTEGRAWQDAGLGYMRMDDGELAERLLGDMRLLRLPLVRFGNAFAVGRDEPTWKAWLTRPG